jgi:hypothetical protein
MEGESLVIDRIVDDLYVGTLDPSARERGLRSIARLIGRQGPILLSVIALCASFPDGWRAVSYTPGDWRANPPK